MILPVYVEPQAILHQPTTQIPEVTSEIRELAASMRETMHNANGIGLAAPQIGQSLAMCIAELADEERRGEAFPYTVFINPQIIWRSAEKSVIEEGCLSLPGIYGNVKRPKKIKVEFTDLDGTKQELSADGLFARVIQHELDHLKGVLFTEYVAEAERTFRKPPAYPQL